MVKQQFETEQAYCFNAAANSIFFDLVEQLDLTNNEPKVHAVVEALLGLISGIKEGTQHVPKKEGLP